ncbi:MAG: hypothetical protein MJD61_03720 [Proteobacteria bacterium]|nr:hypothetical protein [Pseudomonadota bacterium]
MGTKQARKNHPATQSTSSRRAASQQASAATGSEPGAKGKAKRLTGAAAIAQAIVDGTAGHDLGHYAKALDDERDGIATHAARVVEEVMVRRPQLGVGMIEQFVRLLLGHNARVVQTCANALPLLARVAPARVARRLPDLTGNYDAASDVGKDGMVRTFAALCTASVAYQKRLEEVLDRALSGAKPKTLLRWTEIVLPALKGEPHARARAVVEQRLGRLPRPVAQKIADFLGVKLRPAYR